MQHGPEANIERRENRHLIGVRPAPRAKRHPLISHRAGGTEQCGEKVHVPSRLDRPGDSSGAKRADYKIENVRYTQYFTDDGNAIHENWWKDPDTFGLPSSHGCAGLPSADAQKFWEFGEYAMPVIVHL